MCIECATRVKLSHGGGRARCEGERERADGCREYLSGSGGVRAARCDRRRPSGDLLVFSQAKGEPSAARPIDKADDNGRRDCDRAAKLNEHHSAIGR